MREVTFFYSHSKNDRKLNASDAVALDSLAQTIRLTLQRFFAAKTPKKLGDYGYDFAHLLISNNAV